MCSQSRHSLSSTSEIRQAYDRGCRGWCSRATGLAEQGFSMTATAGIPAIGRMTLGQKMKRYRTHASKRMRVPREPL